MHFGLEAILQPRHVGWGVCESQSLTIDLGDSDCQTLRKFLWSTIDWVDERIC